MTETSSQTRTELRQVPLTLACGLTIHKCQGITIPGSFPSLNGIFGFGMPYMLLTRTPFSDNMLFISVPPKDILEILLQCDSKGANALDKKRNELVRALQDPDMLQES